MNRGRPIHNFGGGGGTFLNFKVIAYNSEADLLMAKPPENTIGVVTNNKITAWVFADELSQGLVDGAVWFQTGAKSPVAFNALKTKNGILICPCSAKQYVSGFLIDLICKSYQGGAWVDWWNGELFENGNEYVQMTGGWGCTVESLLENTGEVLAIASSSETPRVYTNNAIDLTGFSTIVANLNLISRSTFRFSVTSNKESSGNYAATTTASKTGEQELTLDISSVTGNYYIQFAAYLSKAEIGSVRLVR